MPLIQNCPQRSKNYLAVLATLSQGADLGSVMVDWPSESSMETMGSTARACLSPRWSQNQRYEHAAFAEDVLANWYTQARSSNHCISRAMESIEKIARVPLRIRYEEK